MIASGSRAERPVRRELLRPVQATQLRQDVDPPRPGGPRDARAAGTPAEGVVQGAGTCRPWAGRVDGTSWVDGRG